jgi:hypothetical protein
MGLPFSNCLAHDASSMPGFYELPPSRLPKYKQNHGNGLPRLAMSGSLIFC